MKKFSTKVVALTLAAGLLVGGTVGGTLAWLMDKTTSVVNTFTVGDINITLTENATDFKMIPGNTITKDPVITVEGGSEACWLFVKIEETESQDSQIVNGSDNKTEDTYIIYDLVNDWTQLNGNPGVYYRSVGALAEDQTFKVLAEDKVSVPNTVSKDMLNELSKDPDPLVLELSFTAYAVQSANVDSAQDAWDAISAQ